MHVAAKIGLVAAGGAATALALDRLDDFADRRIQERLDLVARETTQAQADWQQWSGALEQEFPGARLDTPADHARFERFLQRNPAPSWLTVEHADYTKVRVRVGDGGILSDATRRPDPQGDYYAAGFGAMMAVGGTALAIQGIRSASGSLPALIGMTAGGAALAAFGVYSAVEGARSIRDGDKPYAPARELWQQVSDWG